MTWGEGEQRVCGILYVHVGEQHCLSTGKMRDYGD